MSKQQQAFSFHGPQARERVLEREVPLLRNQLLLGRFILLWKANVIRRNACVDYARRNAGALQVVQGEILQHNMRPL